MSKSTYIAVDSPPELERERLRLLAQLADPITIRRLKSIGIQKGWRCLEVGGGTGSIARWLCERVGADGKVVATDLNPQFLRELREVNLEVRKHDILSDPLEPESYDLVHCRFVLMHLPEPERALQKMAAAVRPGSWLCVEEGDFISYAAVDENHPGAELFNRGSFAILEALRAAGVIKPYFGRRLPGLLEGLGIPDVKKEGVFWINRGGDAGALCTKMSLQIARPKLVTVRILSEYELDQLEHLCMDPGFQFMDATCLGAWGRRTV